MHVKGEALALRVSADLLEPVGRARPDGVGRHTDREPSRAQALDVVEVPLDRRLGERRNGVGGVEEHELDPGLRRGLRRRERRLEAEVVELADGRIAAVEHFLVSRHIPGLDQLRCLTPCECQHRVAPGPEVAAIGTAPERPLKRMAVRVDEARQYETLHRRIVTRRVRRRDHERSSVPP